MSQPGRVLRSVCVFCGSRPGARPEYLDVARRCGALLAQDGIALVYGGGHVGMMGALADAALAAGGAVVGVIPTHLMRPEVAHQRLTELIVVDSMHTRKRTMAQRSDAFLVLPGGVGTFDEMFEMVTWTQLRLHAKPLAIVNAAGYFDRLLDFLGHAAAEGFLHAAHGELLIVEPDPAAALRRLRERLPPGDQPPSGLERA